MNTLSKHWFKIAAVVVVLALAAAIGYKTVMKKEFPHTPMGPATDFKLTNLQGQSTGLSDYDGKVRLVYFFWSTCPDVCSPTTYVLSQVQEKLKEKKAFGNKAEILSVSFDPDRDTPERLKEFSQTFKADPAGWQFLRGGKQETRDLAKQYGVSVIEEKDGSLTHTNAIFIVDKKGIKRHYYGGSDLDLSADQIVEDILFLSKE
ncbi:SCO family protein [Paenibacillus sp. CC-CFT747]|nr:SCO family protein [Paenibacillus sp. CC-CFT747]